MNRYKLGELCEIVSGSTPKTNIEEFWDGNIIWITPAELEEDKIVVYDSKRKLTKLGVKSAGLRPFPKGTVILSSRAPIGKIAIAGCEMYCNQGFKNLICSTKVYNFFLYWLLKSKKEYLNLIGRGATFKELSKQIVSGIEINLPNIEKQVKIASILEKVDSLIKLRKQQLKLLDTLVNARFVEMFGDPVTNTKYLALKDLKDVLVLKAGDFTAASDISNEITETHRYPCYGGNGIRGYVSEYNQKGEYSLIGRQGALSGNIQFAKGRFKNTEHALLVMPIIEMNSIWLNQVLINMELKRYQSGAAQPGLSVKNLQEVKIIIVPMEEQNAFADFVNQVDKSKVS